MVSAPRLRRACPDGAATENGTAWTSSSRLRAVTVTVTSSANCGASSASVCSGGSAGCAGADSGVSSSTLSVPARPRCVIGSSLRLGGPPGFYSSVDGRTLVDSLPRVSRVSAPLGSVRVGSVTKRIV